MWIRGAHDGGVCRWQVWNFRGCPQVVSGVVQEKSSLASFNLFNVFGEGSDSQGLFDHFVHVGLELMESPLSCIGRCGC